MIYSWILAFTYATIYTIFILIIHCKAKLQLSSTVRKKNSLINNQQDLSPNRSTIDENKEIESDVELGSTSATHKPSEVRTHRRSDSSHSQTTDLSTLHEYTSTSTPFGAPVTTFEMCIAIFHSFDSGIIIIHHSINQHLYKSCMK